VWIAIGMGAALLFGAYKVVEGLRRHRPAGTAAQLGKRRTTGRLLLCLRTDRVGHLQANGRLRLSAHNQPKL
jgi:hypothetical protein